MEQRPLFTMVGAVVTKNWLKKNRDPSRQPTEHRFRNKETLLFFGKNLFQSFGCVLEFYAISSLRKLQYILSLKIMGNRR